MKQSYEVGDIIFIRSDIMQSLQHVGIVFVMDGKYYISHNTPYEINVFGGSVSYKPLDQWLQGREVLAIVNTNISSEQIIKATYEMRFRKYDLLKFNCEHYISIIENGKGISSQVNRWILVVVIIAATIAGKRL